MLSYLESIYQIIEKQYCPYLSYIIEKLIHANTYMLRHTFIIADSEKNFSQAIPFL